MAADDETALEYVLGLLDEDERRDFEIVLLDDPGLAEAVWQWEERMAPLALSLKPRKAPRRVRRALDRTLHPRVYRKAETRLRGLRFWRMLSGLLAATAVAAAAALVVVVARPDLVAPVERAAAPLWIAAVVLTDGEVVLLRQRDDDGFTVAPLEVGHLAEAADGPRVPQIWLVREAADPVSLGVPEAGGETVLPLPEATRQALEGAVELHVTAEPEGGSPTGQPTGPLIGTGPLRRF